MRNITVAHRRDWIVNQPAQRPPDRRSRVRDWLATLPIILLIPALAVPIVIASAAGPTMKVSPRDPEPGERITITGERFTKGEDGELVWADGGEAVASFEAGRTGRFTIKVRLPESLDAGAHRLVALSDDDVVRATLDIEVELDDDDDHVDESAPTPESPAKVVPPTSKPVAVATPRATTPKPTAATAPQAAATPAPTPKPTPTPTAAVAPKAPAELPPTPVGDAILITQAALARLPVTGTAWTSLKARADASASSPNLSNQDDATDQVVLAKALVYARTGSATYRSAVLAALHRVVGTETGGRTLALGRNLPAYVIAADLIGLRTADPTFDRTVFRPWLKVLLTKSLSGMTLRGTHEQRPNNWGTHAGAARAAIAAYLGDRTELARTAQVFRGYLGDRSAYAGFKYGDLGWQCDPARPVGINPAGCTKGGASIDGALPEEMRRAGAFSWPPKHTDYAWEGMQGAVLQAELLHQAGYDTWSWSNRALLRAARFLDRIGWSAQGDDTWQPWLINRRYGSSIRTAPARSGKNFGYTDWLYGS